MAEAPGRPVLFGEVLLDCFEDGSSVLGGAPFNVAWHLQGFGLAPLLISRVGRDAAGDRVLAAMEGWGMDTTGVQRDSRRPTGAVEITLKDAQPEFHILPAQAYDFITADPALLSGSGARSLLYHGTLALRGPVSRASLTTLRAASALPVFLDVNLRPPWSPAERVDAALAGGRWVKLNDIELDRLPVPGGGTPERRARRLIGRYGLDLVMVTLGARGARLVSAGRTLAAAPPPAAGVMDTVGAGDAFSAVAILGLTRAWSWPEILDRAVGFATAVCAQRGATAPDRRLYRRHLQAWQGPGQAPSPFGRGRG